MNHKGVFPAYAYHTIKPYYRVKLIKDEEEILENKQQKDFCVLIIIYPLSGRVKHLSGNILNFTIMIESSIFSLLSDPSLEAKKELINFFIDRTKRKKSNKAYIATIEEFIYQKDNLVRYKNYVITGPKHSLSCLLSHFLYRYLEVETFHKQAHLLRRLLQDNVDKLELHTGRILKKNEVVKLIELVKNFGLQSEFLRTKNQRPLTIYLIPFKHTILNGAYFPYINSIMSLKTGDANLFPEYIFLHEVGHLLAYNLTGEPNSVPDSFLKFNEQFNPSWKGELLEVFVDLFSIAVMLDTEYEVKNPLINKFRRDSCEIIKKYFLEVVNDAKYYTSPTNEYLFIS